MTVPAHDMERGIEGEQQRRRIPYWRRGCEVAAKRRAIAYWRGSEQIEPLVHDSRRPAPPLSNLRQRHRSTNADARIGFRTLVQLAHGLEADKMRPALQTQV